MHEDPAVTIIRLYWMYLKAGAPYGDSDRGFVRWVRERHRQERRQTLEKRAVSACRG